jgi:hypothetical protein
MTPPPPPPTHTHTHTHTERVLATPHTACPQPPSPAPHPRKRSDDVSTYTVLKQSFDAAYGGNRAPFPIFGHTPWLLDRKADVKRFLGGWRCLVFGVCVCVDVFLGCVCGMGGSDERLGMSMGQRCPQKWRQAAGSSRLGVCTACVAP